MKPKSSNLIWIDLEMTGLNTDEDRIIEIATVVTDKDLNLLEEGPVFAVHQSDERLEAMDNWNQKHHSASGLVDRVKASTVSEADAEDATIEFLMKHVGPGKSPMCGNSICQDRRFLHHHMPHLEKYFHYRHIDVSTIKILAKHWVPKIYNGYKKETEHTALSDIHDSISELCYYRENFFKLDA